jgi:beta-N-acetylhexosaminidase
VSRLKARSLSWDELPGEDVPVWVGGEEHRQLAEEAYARSVTLVRNDAGLLPLRPGPDERLLVLFPHGEPASAAEDPTATAGAFAESIRRRHPRVDATPLSLRPEAEEIERLGGVAESADVVLIVTKNANLYPEQAELVRRIAHPSRRLAVVAAHNPYDLLAFPGVRTYLATYEDTAPALEAAARLLFGEIEPQGRLPVSLPGLYPLGHGLGLRGG